MAMAYSLAISIPTLLLITSLLSLFVISFQQQQPLLPVSEQDSVYEILHSVNSDIPWRTLFPDDLCSSSPHGVVCDIFSDSSNTSQPDTAQITELNFGFVSEYTPNPPCSPNSTLNFLLFSSFKYLRKLFFYKCFTEETNRVSVPGDVSISFGSSLEELIFVDNPSLVGPISGLIRNFTNLRRLVLTGNGVYGQIPEIISELVNLEEIRLSGNQLSGGVPVSLNKSKKLKIIDLSRNYFDGNVPESLGNSSQLLKLDLSSNRFVGKIPESLRNLKNLEFLDLSFNRFGNFGIPMFLSEMPRLREVYLSGNLLGGKIPEIWENVGGILGIGLSGTGLVGKIPSSMGLYLQNLSYLALDNNKLEGTVPREFELLKSANEINLENNNLSGKVQLSAEIGKKIRLKGNSNLCMDDNKNEGHVGNLKICSRPDIPNSVNLSAGNGGFNSVHMGIADHAIVFLLGLVCFVLG